MKTEQDSVTRYWEIIHVSTHIQQKITVQEEISCSNTTEIFSRKKERTMDCKE
jgi:hypothetical protein